MDHRHVKFTQQGQPGAQRLVSNTLSLENRNIKRRELTANQFTAENRVAKTSLAPNAVQFFLKNETVTVTPIQTVCQWHGI